MAKDRPPSFPWYPANWFSDTRHMTRDQRCRYFEALMLSWLEKSYGMASEERWMRWLGYTPRTWAPVRGLYAERFIIGEDGTWTQKKLSEVRAEQMEYRERAAAGGRATKAAQLPDIRRSAAQTAANTRWDAKRDANRDAEQNAKSAFDSAFDSNSDSKNGSDSNPVLPGPPTPNVRPGRTRPDTHTQNQPLSNREIVTCQHPGCGTRFSRPRNSGRSVCPTCHADGHR